MTEKYDITGAAGSLSAPIGLKKTPGGFCISVVSPGKSCTLLLFRKGSSEPFQRIDFPEAQRIGDVHYLEFSVEHPEETEYALADGPHVFADPCALSYSGHENWRDSGQTGRPRRSPLVTEPFDWEGDRPLHVPYELSVIYKLHVRGFTESVTSGVSRPGTFAGIIEKIPYLKELGVTAVELQPCQEFDELKPAATHGIPQAFLAAAQENSAAEAGSENGTAAAGAGGRVNYWGYTDAFRFAPKAAYCGLKELSPVSEFRTLVKTLHAAGLEIIPEIYFTGNETVSYVLQVLRAHVCIYHVDGIHLVGNVPAAQIAGDPYLTETKLFFDNWDGSACGRLKHLASYNDGFEQDMRRILKGDEGMLGRLVFHTRSNPRNAAVVNYMANTNGFTMMDMVSYEIKHNEENGEGGSDGTDSNYSWNCGVEGPTKKKKIRDLRLQQIRNAYLLLFLSQGTPLIQSGDEFGQTKLGNNNSWCQDNGVSWLNWKLVKSNRRILQFVKHVVAFRKAHPVFHYAEEPKLLDALAMGIPDVSYHGVNAWQPEFENWRRQLGILYCGDYASQKDGQRDSSFYVLYNMHWEPHEFALPNPEKGTAWFLCMDTSDQEKNGFCPAGEETLLEDQKKYMMPPRTIAVMTAKPLQETTAAEHGTGKRGTRSEKRKTPRKNGKEK